MRWQPYSGVPIMKFKFFLYMKCRNLRFDRRDEPYCTSLNICYKSCCLDGFFSVHHVKDRILPTYDLLTH